MTAGHRSGEQRKSLWLPALVVSIFALVFLADVMVIILYGNYRNLIENEGVDVLFTPAEEVAFANPGKAVKIADGSRVTAADGTVLVESENSHIKVSVPGSLVFRFRAPDAGRYVELGYRFGHRRPRARCEVALARVASRYGVDDMCRRSLAAKRRIEGRFRQYLADHAGWFELSVEINPDAAAGGFQITKPMIVRD